MTPCLLCVPVPVLSHLREKPDGFLVPLGLLAPKSSLSLLFCFAGRPAAPHCPCFASDPPGSGGQTSGAGSSPLDDPLVLFPMHPLTDVTPSK